MNLKRKRVFSLVMTFTMLFTTVGTAAATEPIDLNTQSAIMAGTEPASTFDMAGEETEKDNKENTEEKTEEETEETEDNSAEETEKETEETKENTEEGTEEETKENDDADAEDETKEDDDADTEDETKEDDDADTEDEMKEDGDADAEDEMKEENDTEAEDETKEENESETDAMTEEESKAEDGDLIDNEGNALSESLENSDEELPEDLTSSIHEHSWSTDWKHDGTYHWHACSAKDCPVTDNIDKDGYAEHSYDDDGVCTECGYDAMEGIAVAAGDIPTYQDAYEMMIALKEKYPEGMTWTNFEPYGTNGKESAYTWKGGAIYGAKSAVGCMAFAFILSDEVFGSLPARPIKSFTFKDVKVGDILRVNGNSHSVIVLQKSSGGVTVAEANFKKTVHWGRSMSVAEVEAADFIVTRYPENYIPKDDPEADKVVKEGKAGTLNWSLTKAGALTISGKGAIPDYASGDAPWSSENFNTITIEKGVTEIGNYAFDHSNALSVYIPNTVTAIGEGAFNESALLSVTIPGSVKIIGDDAFYNCENLTSATVPEGVTTIGSHAFHGCTALTYIDFPKTIRSVGEGAFESCKSMVRIRFVPGNYEVVLGEGVFRECWDLISVTLPQTATNISSYMFQSCKLLPALYIPKSVTEIGSEPFTSCPSLKFIYFGGSETDWKNLTNPYLEASLKQNGTTVKYNVVFEDPFADEPNDPGDFHPDEDVPCTNHVDTNKDGKCDNCGALMPTDNDGEDETKPGDDETKPGDGETKPGDGDDTTDPDDDKNDSSGPSDGNKPPSTGGSNSSGGSSGGSNSGSSSSGNSNSSSSSNNSNNSSNSGNSGNSDKDNGLGGYRKPVVYSTSIKRNADGSSVITKTQDDGTITSITNNIAGKAEMDVKLSTLAVSSAQQYGVAVALPISAVEAVKDASMASPITVHTGKDALVRVAIPTISPTAATVAVIVNADGSTEIVKASVLTEDGIVASLPDGAMVKIVDNSKNFLDVPPGAWFEDAAAFVSARELFHDTTETNFAPDAPMTYAALTTALARFDGAETDDITTGYAKSMAWADAHGINDGTDPGSNITFTQLITMLWKYSGSPATAGTLPASADGSPGISMQESMRWAMENGIVSGFENTSLDLQGNINRAQAAQILMNFVNKITINPAQ